MKNKAKIVCISFKSPEQHKMAVRKAKANKRTLSGEIQHHFETLALPRKGTSTAS